jgi:hypothetical protein
MVMMVSVLVIVSAAAFLTVFVVVMMMLVIMIVSAAAFLIVIMMVVMMLVIVIVSAAAFLIVVMVVMMMLMFVIVIMSAAAFFIIVMMMVVMMFMFVIVIMSAAASVLIKFELIKVFVLGIKIKSAFHNFLDLLTVYFIPVCCDNKSIRIELVESISTFFKFVLINILCTAEDNKPCTLDLVDKEFSEKLDVLCVFLYIDNSCV